MVLLHPPMTDDWYPYKLFPFPKIKLLLVGPIVKIGLLVSPPETPKAIWLASISSDPPLPSSFAPPVQPLNLNF